MNPQSLTHKRLTPVRLIYAFITWTAVTISLLLLILGLILAAPWQILLLLAVIPTVGIFMPHDLQKWCWMVMAIVVITIYIWIRSPEKEASQWQPYVFEEKITAYVYKRQIPDSLNAALHYDALFARHSEDVFLRPVDDQTEQAAYLLPWDENSNPEFTRWIESFEPDIDTLLKISRMPECRFNPSVDIKTLNAQFSRINTHKAFTRVLIQSANNDIQKGLILRAVQKELTTLHMARHLWQQKTILDQAAGYYLERMGRRALSRLIVMSASDPDILDAIEQEYLQLDTGWPKGWEKILTNEKILTIGMSGIFYQQNDRGHIRISRNIAEGLRHHMGSRFSKYALSSELSRMMVLSLALSIPAQPAGTARLIENRFDRYSAIVLSDGDLETTVPEQWWHDGLNAASVIDWYARQRVAYYYPLAAQNTQFEQNRAVIKILIALKRYYLQYGTWPESLQAAFMNADIPFDPVTQKPFVYKKQNSSFTLHSIGKNGVDENGIKNSYAKPVQDDTLFWPPPGISNGEEQ